MSGSIPFKPRPPARTADHAAFAIGSRLLMTAATPRQRDIELTDEYGMLTGLRMAVDAVVTVTAWKPRRGAPARYRVRTAEGVEGWTEAANLRRLPPPPAPPTPPPPPRPAVVAKPVPTAKVKRPPPRPAAKAPEAKAAPKPAPKAAPKATAKPARARPAPKRRK